MMKYLGIIIWYSPKSEKGVLADLNGETWIFRSTRRSNPAEYKSVFQNGFIPETIEHPTRHYMVTSPSLVWFEIDFFNYSDGRQGNCITSIESATEFSEADAAALRAIRERIDTEKKEAKRARSYEKNVSQGLGFRTRRYG